jgi:hypothetical protein
MHFYPEVNTDGLVSEIWHGAKLCMELSPKLLTPMFDVGHGVHYYVDELAQLTDGRLVIPVHWIKLDGAMHVDVYSVELNAEVHSPVIQILSCLFHSEPGRCQDRHLPSIGGLTRFQLSGFEFQKPDSEMDRCCNCQRVPESHAQPAPRHCKR